MFRTLVLALIVQCVRATSYGLNAADGWVWNVQNENKSISTFGTVPGGIYSDLQKAGVLEDFFYRSNDILYRWVARDNFTYSVNFSVTPDVLNKASIVLVLEGVDTVADVTLNDVHLLSVDNMFVRYKVDIKDILKEEGNILEVAFKSPIAEAQKRYDEQRAASYAVPPTCILSSYQGECHVNHLRKMQASFAWDWGPAFPSVGLWKPVSIDAFNVGKIQDVTVDTIRSEGGWKVNATVFVESPQQELEGLMEMYLGLANQTQLKTTSDQSKLRPTERNELAKLNTFSYELLLEVTDDDVEMWWPNGFGNPTLYDVRIQFLTARGVLESEKNIKIGFRDVKLIQKDLVEGEEGKTFYFEVNGEPIFMKGSNWIPAHILPELGQDESVVRPLLKSAKDTNMNMLRVWGGGVYESDLFYSIADEYGILIWQDMMFACSMYPASEPFLKSVVEETRQQVRRLHHHPSIAVYGGNNENEAALRNNWYFTIFNFEAFKKDYVKLYVDTMRTIFNENDPNRAYVVSSPSNGVQSELEGHIAEDPYSPLYGDVHHYDYNKDPWDPQSYPYGRFISEFGQQAWPSLTVLATVSDPDKDWATNSPFVSERQHHLLGNLQNMNLIKKHLRIPSSDKRTTFEVMTYYTQIMQAQSIKTETEKFRRDRGLLTKDNIGNTMGALFWQLNDVWPAPSWSAIEYGGGWKLLQYFSKDFFSRFLVSPVLDSNSIKVFLVSDALVDVADAVLAVFIHSWDSFGPKSVYLQTQHTMLKSSSVEVESIELSDALRSVGCKKQDCFFRFTLSKDNKTLSENFLFLDSDAFKDHRGATGMNFQIANVNAKAGSAIGFDLIITQVAAFVTLESPFKGVFSENGFHMTESKRYIEFTPTDETVILNSNVTLQEFASSLTVKTVATPTAQLVKYLT